LKKLILICAFALPLVASAQLPPGAIAEYPFDNTVSDISGNSYNGSLTGTTPAVNRLGEAGKATAFVAGSSSGQFPGLLKDAVSGNFSIGFWFKTSMGASSGGQWYNGNAMIDAEVCGATTDWGIALINGGKVAFGIGGDVTIQSPLNYNNGAWHFITATRNQSSGTFTLYVDGTGVATGAGTLASLVAPTHIGIGNNPCSPTGVYTGMLDDIIFYDRVLSNTEVLNLYNFSTLTTLPLKWLAFTGLEKNNQVTLHWKVANMVNTETFVVESSHDGRQFTSSGSVPAMAGISHYSYQPPNKMAAGTNYFRIRQVDKDGKSAYSDVISIRTGLPTNSLSIARNPVTSLVSVNNPGQTIVHQLVITDAAGRRLISQQTRSSNTLLNVDISKLQPGQYFILVYSEGSHSVLPFVKQR
jgi:concanavalin A-like lectin/glucanase superfamily protein